MTPRACYVVLASIVACAHSARDSMTVGNTTTAETFGQSNTSAGHGGLLQLDVIDASVIATQETETTINLTTSTPSDDVTLLKETLNASVNAGIVSKTSTPRDNTIPEIPILTGIAKLTQSKPSAVASGASYHTTPSSMADAAVDGSSQTSHRPSPPEVTRTKHGATEQYVLNRLLDPDVYDPSIRPGVDEGLSTRVEIDLTVNSVGPVNDRDMEVSISFFLRQEWRDPRLSFNDFNRSLTVSHKRHSSVWVPDLYFIQAKAETLHGAETPNVMIRLAPDGAILFTQRISLVVQCRLKLEKFPMDQQACQITMESYSHTTDAVYFVWSDTRKAIRVQPETNIPDFTLVDILSEGCTSTYSTGMWTCLKAVIILKRELGFYIHQTYIPSILIVVLSWVSFWIDHEAVPARISVGLITVLTITTQSSGARAQLPRVPYVKAIDVWMLSCLLFVVAAYIESAVVIVQSRLHRKKLAHDSRNRKAHGGLATDPPGDADVDSTSAGTPCRAYPIGSPASCDPTGTPPRSYPTGSPSKTYLTGIPYRGDTTRATISHETPSVFDPIETPAICDITNPPSISDPTETPSLRHPTGSTIGSHPGKRVDLVSKVAFPVLFTAFNIVYWLAFKLIV